MNHFSKWLVEKLLRESPDFRKHVQHRVLSRLFSLENTVSSEEASVADGKIQGEYYRELENMAKELANMLKNFTSVFSKFGK